MGLDAYLYDHAPENDDDESGRVEMDSQKYPQHLFKIGYFRSSYNQAGFNSVVDALIGESLYSIFDVDGHDEYIIHPDWAASKDRAVEAREKYIKRKEETQGFDTEQVSVPLQPSQDEKSIMDAFLKEYSKDHTAFGNFSNAGGTYFLNEPLKVYGVFVTKSGMFPRIILVVKSDDGWKPETDWYLHAFDIVIETCDHVLSQPNPDSFVLHWSA